MQATFIATLDVTLLSYLHDIQDELTYGTNTVRTELYVSLMISATLAGTAGTCMALCQRWGSSDKKVSSRAVYYFRRYFVVHMMWMMASVYVNFIAIGLFSRNFVPLPFLVVFLILVILCAYLTPWCGKNTGEVSQV
jgi:hypothetical protein